LNGRHRGRAGFVKAGGGTDAQTVLQRPPDRFLTVLQHGTATAFPGRSAKTAEDAFANHGPLELGEDAEHLEHHPTRGRARVQSLLVQIEIDVLGLSFIQEGDQIGQAAAQPVHAPGHDLFEVLPGDPFEHGIIARAFVPTFGTRDAFIGVDGDDDPALAVGDRVQFLKLVLDSLAVGGDTSIDGHALGQVGSPSMLEERQTLTVRRPVNEILTAARLWSAHA